MQYIIYDPLLSNQYPLSLIHQLPDNSEKKKTLRVIMPSFRYVLLMQSYISWFRPQI